MASRTSHHRMTRRAVFAVLTLLAAACGRPDPAAKSADGTGTDRAPTPPKQKIVLTINQMTNTPQVPLSVKRGDHEIKLEAIFEQAGIALEVRRNRSDLPYAPEVTLGNLHALMLANRTATPLPADQIGVNLLVATKESGRPQDLGIMFDYGDTDTDNFPREGFAVFADVHENLAAGRDPELMLTIAHELTHVLNLHHADWEPGQAGGTFDGGSTIESYSTARDVKWALSERSKQHLLNDPAREKWPGQNNLAFGFLLQEHFKRHQLEPDNEIWNVIEVSGLTEKGRHARVSAEQTARGAPRDRTQVLPIDQSDVKLKLEVPRTTYEVGEPLTVTVGLHNAGNEAYHVRPLLDPSYGFLSLEIELPPARPEDKQAPVFLPFRPAVMREARTVRTDPLAPGTELHDEAKVFFGAGGWTFGQPGTYRIRADFPAPATSEAAALSAKQRIQSNILTVQVVAPRTPAGRVASTKLIGIKGGLDLLLGSVGEEVKQVVALGGNSPQVAAARMVVVNAVNQTPDFSQQTEIKVEEALRHLSRTDGAATGPFSIARAYDQLAEALDKEGKTAEAAKVRRRLTVRLAKVEAGAEALKRVDATRK